MLKLVGQVNHSPCQPGRRAHKWYYGARTESTMAKKLRVLLSPARLTGFLLAVTAVFLVGLLPGLPTIADPTQPGSPRRASHSSGLLHLPAGQERLVGEPIRVPLSTAGWTTILYENFEGTWPSAGWRTFDDDGATNGEYYWANRCAGHYSNRSAWGIGGGAQGSSLDCGAVYPC